MTWGLYSIDGEPLPPLTFSDRRTQEECIDEILDLFKGSNYVFLHGAVGSGKSIIAATVAGKMGRGIINVPVKPLQDQYYEDFTNRFRICLGELPLEIKMLKGRGNFLCRRAKGRWCNHRTLPCTIRLKKRDEEGKKVPVPRWETAKECPYWSPIYPFRLKGEVKKELEPLTTVEYENSVGKKMYLIRRAEGCGYYDQNIYYISADILIYNNAKWKADTLSGRKPGVQIEIFDEADAFFDGLILRTTLTDKRLKLIKDLCTQEKREDPEAGNYLERAFRDIRGMYRDIIESTVPDTPKNVTEVHTELLTRLKELLTYLDREELQDLETATLLLLEYQEMLIYYASGKGLTFFVPRPDIVLRDYLARSSRKILFMSATMQSLEMLSQIYGIKDLAYAIGEPTMPGKIKLRKTGKEQHMSYSKWQNKDFRRKYYKTLSRMLENAARPTLVQVHSFKYLPEKRIGLLPSRRRFKETNQDEEITLFTSGRSNILFSTKTDRGIDLPDEKCRSIVLQKYPYPSLKDPVLVTMRRKFGEKAFWTYYRDIAERELLQQIGRGLRHPHDWIEVWSPDIKIHGAIKRLMLPKAEKRLGRNV